MGSGSLFRFQIREPILEATLEQVSRTLKPERILIAYRRRSDENLTLVAQRGFVGSLSLETADVSHSTIEEVYQGAGTRTSNEQFPAPRPTATASMNFAGLRSVLCAPIITHEHGIIGVIYADDKRVVGAFGQAHVDWLTRIGKALGSTITAEQVVIKPVQAEPSTPSEWWKHYRAQAWNARGANDLQSAESFLKQALGCCSDADLPGLCLSRTLNDLSEVYRQQGRLDEAESLIKEAIKVADAYREVSYAQKVPFYNNLAGLLYARERWNEAEDVYESILSALRNHGLDDSQVAIPVLCNLGTLLLKVGEVVRALHLFGKASKIAETEHGRQSSVTQRCRKKLQECRQLLAS